MKLRRQTIVAALDRDEADDSLAVARFVLEYGDTSWNPADAHDPISGPCEVSYVRQLGSVTARVYDVHMNTNPDTCCSTCRQPVETYRPTGTRGVLRAVRHPESAYAVGGFQCAGSFGPVESAASVEQDRQRTEAWRRVKKEIQAADGLLSILNGTVARPRTAFRADCGPSLREFLASKGEC